MKCPFCQKETKFIEFYIKSHPFKTTCKSCGTRLMPDRIYKKMMTLEVVLGVIMGISTYYLKLNSLGDWALWLIGIAIIVYAVDYCAWKKGSYLTVEIMETV